MKIINSFPSVPTLIEAKKDEFAAVIHELKSYMQDIRECATKLEHRAIVVPSHMLNSPLLGGVYDARIEIVAQYVTLMEKSDALADQLQYLYDALEVKRISEMIDEQRETEEILEDLSSYLNLQAVQFEKWSFGNTLTEKSSDVQSFSADIRSRIIAEREVEASLRTRLTDVPK
jgi:hypothetical protein